MAVVTDMLNGERPRLNAGHGKVVVFIAASMCSVHLERQNLTMATCKWHMFCQDGVMVVFRKETSVENVHSSSCSNCEASLNYS